MENLTERVNDSEHGTSFLENLTATSREKRRVTTMKMSTKVVEIIPR